MEERNFKPFMDHEARRIFKQLANAVQYCHSQKVVHFDIKLDNIMFDSKTFQTTLIDFGLCDFIKQENDKFEKKVGSSVYCARELLDDDVPFFSGTKVDVWCLGVVLYALLCASFPFDLEVRYFLL